MIDVHPTHHGSFTRRDFFIHLGIVVLGILIAIGLEQTVEHVHRLHQAAELRANLRSDSQQVLSDTDHCIASFQYATTWLSARTLQVKQTVWQHQPLAAAAAFKAPPCASPDLPIWRIAKESGLAFYLSKSEVTGYSEIEFVLTLFKERTVQAASASHATRQFLATFPSFPDGQPDLSAASPEDLHRYLTLLSVEEDGNTRTLDSLHLVRGATRAVAGGEANLNAIYQAEHADVASDPILRRYHHF
jgi:hypothetical protein